MYDHRTLPNAPIVEAAFAIQMLLPPGDNAAVLESLYSQFATEYPKRRTENAVNFGVQIKQGNATGTASSAGLVGYRFCSTDGKRVVQCRRNGFSFSQLAPYSKWEDFRGLALPAWEIYRKVFPEATIQRIGLRYINKIKLPLKGQIELSDFLLMCPPDVPIEGVTYTGFLSRSTLLDQRLRLKSNWILASQNPQGEVLPIVLDIDVYDDGPGLHGVDLGIRLEEMREFKNRLFFSSFTDKGFELFT